MTDVLVVGAGPAGAVAATVLARAGARVRLIDRARFPRPKLCGDTINPGALAMLRRLRMIDRIEARARQLTGMMVTGEHDVAVTAPYPLPLHGLAIGRHDLDAELVACAIEAGARFDDGVTARGLVFTPQHGEDLVSGVDCLGRDTVERACARVVVAADGRHSTLAFALGLAAHPAHTRRWAIGAYVSGVDGLQSLGEMHIRRDRYIGIAPMADGRANVCVVGPAGRLSALIRGGATALLDDVRADDALAPRLRHATADAAPLVLGPLAVNRTGAAAPTGLLMAGDAAGFVDPMTGDGLRFAIRGGELAAEAALAALARGWDGVHARLHSRTQGEFAGKWRFNRTLRALVGAPGGVRTATYAARVAPFLVRSLVMHASDCALA